MVARWEKIRISDEPKQKRLRNLSKPERAAIEAVARRFSVKPEGDDPLSGAYRPGNGKRVAIQIATLTPGGAGKGKAAKPHLRFDKVATRVLESLRSALEKMAPGGATVLFAISAPIRLASKTTAALETKIQDLLERGSRDRAIKAAINGNRVTIRILRTAAARAPRMIGFVHNADSDPIPLFNLTRDLLRALRAKGGRERRTAPVRWLVVRGAPEVSWFETYRCIYWQMRTTHDYDKVVLMSGDGKAEVLAG